MDDKKAFSFFYSKLVQYPGGQSMQIGEYNVRETLHQGNRFTVYRAAGKEDETPCILKVLNKSHRAAPGIDAIENEYRLLKLVESEHIIKAYELLRTNDYILIVLEDIQGINLKEFLKKGAPFSPGQFLELAQAITGGLGAIHQQNIIHKDINPTNIIWNPGKGKVKIIDFDIAARYDVKVPPLGNPDRLAGTLPYISPEQTGRMNRRVDQRSDLYSLGVTFYEMLTDRLPFQHHDPMEIIYDHLARDPVPPHLVDDQVPGILSKIIMKLLAKDPESRYQSAAGLIYDLEKVREVNRPDILHPDDFTLGKKDFPGKLHIPEKLYGREKEIDQLLSAYTRITGGTGEMVLVSGYPGTGKTALVNELYKSITRDRGYFISGKFDYLQRNVPYLAFIQAIGQFCDLLLSEVETVLDEWKQSILKAVGELGKLLTDIIPNLEHIIGKQPDVSQVGGTEAKNRFNYIFQRFIRAISTKEHPLVMFIDDWQWADHASLDLLKLLMGDEKNQYLLFIGAYRDNEVSHSHSLMVIIGELLKQNVPISTIQVKNLTVQNINDWLQDALRAALLLGTQDIENLSNHIYRKTQGNAFFTVQFLENLYKEGFLTFDTSRSTWTWDIKEIDRLDITDNVVDLLLRRIQSLPQDVQGVLKLSSCAGNIFDLETLAVISGKDTQIQEPLEIALRENLIYPLDDTHYKFGHDRIQQAAYALISDSDKKPVHLKIGRLLLEEFHLLDDDESVKITTETEPRIFDIVNHFNIGIDLVTEEEEKIRVIQLNRKAAQKAMAATAYQPGWEYMEKALLLIPGDGWQRYYDLILAVHNEAIQLAYLSSKYTEMECLGEQVLKHAGKILDRSIVYEYRIMGLIAQNKFEIAVKTSLEILGNLGIDIPGKPSEQDMAILAQTKAMIDEKGLQGLEKLPPMTDEKKQLAMRLYLRISGAVVMAAQDLYPFMINKMLLLTLQHGKTPETPYLVSEYGNIATIMGNIPDAFKYTSISTALLGKNQGFETLEIRLHTLSYVYTLHWKLHYKVLAQKFWELHQRAVNAGDLEYCSYCLYNYMLLQLHVSQELGTAVHRGKSILEIMSEMKQPFSRVVAKIGFQTIENLCGKNQNPTQLNVDMGTFAPIATEETRRYKQFYENISRLLFNCLFENYEILDCSDIIQKAPLLKPIVQYSYYVFYSTIIKLQVLKKALPDEKQKLLDEVRDGLKQIQEWADFGPDNFLHRYYLIQAELTGINGKIYEAGEYYDKAIETANRNEFLCDEALSNELAAKFYLQNQREPLAVYYFQRAYRCYRQWGAIAKIKHLEENYPKYLSMGFPAAKLSGTGTISSVSTDTTDEFLDVTSIIKASQTLAGEVQLTRLLEKMMDILIENAGAQKSMLIENIDDRLLIQAEGTVDGVSGILQHLPVEESGNVPLSVINYVARGQKKLVFDNISKDPIYSPDDYIQKHHTKSVVCFPVIRKEKLSAIIYLENNLVEGAFTPERMNVLKTLSAQIAISLENARIYRDLNELNISLEQKVAERTRELEEMDKAKSRFFANISHEFRTPLTLIMGPLEKRLSTARDKQDIQEMQMMLRNSRRLLNLINQLLELARLDSGKIKLQAAEQNIVPFLKSIVMCFESLAVQNKVGLVFHKEKDDITLYFDPEKLEKIITNLLSNAFNYTPEGGSITVLVRRPAETGSFPSGCVEISVRDTGSGIPANHLPHIFDRFYRVDGTVESKRKGSGIGLALTKELVELHHGEIEVQSSCRDDHSRGTEFSLRLPMGEKHLLPEEIAEAAAPADQLPVSKGPSPAYAYAQSVTAEEEMEIEEEPGTPAETAAGQPQVPGEQEEKPLILVVDDNADVRTYVRGSLEPYFKVVEAADGREGILRAKEIIPDLIVSDVMMPEADGFELCRTLKSDVLTSHVPIILLTAKVSEESELQGLETGADDYITKPFSTTVLAVRVRNLIDLRRQLQLEQKNRMILQPEELPVSPLDDEFYKNLLDTIEAHLSDSDFNVEALSQVMEMSQATLYRKIHGLTGQSPTLFLRSFRIKRAAQLLAANAGSVAEVADKVGFPDKSYFAKCFKEQFNRLPSEIQAAGIQPDIEAETEKMEVGNNEKLLRGVQGGGFLEKSPPGNDEPPPVLGSWRNLYLLVLGNLLFWIALFTLFTWIFR